MGFVAFQAQIGCRGANGGGPWPNTRLIWRSVHGSSSGPRAGLIHRDSPGIGHRALPGQRQQSLRDQGGYGIDHERIGPFIPHAGFTRRAEGGSGVALKDTAGAGQEAVADTGPNANPNGNTGANSDTMAHTPADSNTSPDANPNGNTGANTDTHSGANADANRATNPRADTHARPDADSATGRHPGDAAGQLIVRADPLDVARQRRSRPDLPQRTLDR